jgi:UDP-glucose:(heptosyl)LPS alpha-1,3-glucosyltransferase
MKIAVVRRQCGKSWGGAERYCAQVVKTLTEFGHEVTLIAKERENSSHESCFIPIRYRARGSVLKNYLFFVKVERVLTRTVFDIVYGLSRVHPVDVYKVTDPLHAAWIEERYQSRFTRRLASVSLRHRLLLSLEKKIMEDPRVRIVAVSTFVTSQLGRFYGLPQSCPRLSVIHHGVDLHQFNPAARKAGRNLRQELGLQSKKVFLFVGSEWKRKGFETLVRSMSSLGQKECHLLVVGLMRKHIPFCLPGNVQERTTFVGWVSNPEIYYGAADLMVLPTRNDPFGNVCLEAMACGTPVLTTRYSGAADIIDSGQNGFIVEDPRSQHELRDRLEEYLSLSPSDRALMGEKAALRASRLTWETHVEKLIGLFRSTVRQK